MISQSLRGFKLSFGNKTIRWLLFWLELAKVSFWWLHLLLQSTRVGVCLNLKQPVYPERSNPHVPSKRDTGC